MGSYQNQALDSASAVDLVVALYDGIIRFLYLAMDAVDRANQDDRRIAVKRALDIIIHLQARLRMDVGGRPAVALSEFYATIFAQIMQASQSASRQKFEHTIDCVREVRDAWKKVAQEVNQGEPDTSYRMSDRAQARLSLPEADSDSSSGGHWSA